MTQSDGISRATVVGTGRTGPTVAAAFARAGVKVRVAGRSLEKAEAAAAEAGRLAGSEVAAVGLGAEAVTDADLVVETVLEDVAIKRDVLAQIEGWARPGTLLATNTSSLRLADLADGLTRTGDFLGMHFLHPADITPVVEVVRGPATSDAALGRGCAVAAQIGKRALVVQRDIAGFIWNRIQMAVLRECLHLLDAGVADVEALDAAVADGLAPRWVGGGPFLTADLGGVATFGRVAAQLFPALANDTTVSPTLSGRGEEDTFYAWDEATFAAFVHHRRALLAEQLQVVDGRRRHTPLPAS